MNINEHPFTSYFDVHQGYKVLTHCHIKMKCNHVSPPVGRCGNVVEKTIIGYPKYERTNQQKMDVCCLSETWLNSANCMILVINSFYRHGVCSVGMTT